jgi:hypothetical protein
VWSKWFWKKHSGLRGTRRASIAIDGKVNQILTFDSLRTRRKSTTVLQSLGLLCPLRELYSQTEVAKVLGLHARDFKYSFPEDGEPTPVLFKGRTFSEVFSLSIEEALEIFHRIPQLRRPLSYAKELGLGYLLLGQRELSTGEEKRVLLARMFKELRRVGGSTLFLLDEPMQGLHKSEQGMLQKVLTDLVGQGHTVVAVDHSSALRSVANQIIELGPGGGEKGGRILED